MLLKNRKLLRFLIWKTLVKKMIIWCFFIGIGPPFFKFLRSSADAALHVIHCFYFFLIVTLCSSVLSSRLRRASFHLTIVSSFSIICICFLLQIGGERVWELHARVFWTVCTGQGKISRTKQATEETKEEKTLKDRKYRPRGLSSSVHSWAEPFDLLNHFIRETKSLLVKVL